MQSLAQKQKPLNLGPKVPSLGIFGLKYEDGIIIFDQHPQTCQKCFFFLIHMVNFVIGIRPRCTDLLLTNSQSTFKETYRKNTPSNKTGALTKSMNIYIWVICILNQLFISDYYTQIEFLRK